MSPKSSSQSLSEYPGSGLPCSSCSSTCTLPAADVAKFSESDCAFEGDRLCHQFAAAHRCLHRNESVEPQRVTAQEIVVVGPVALDGVERKFVGCTSECAGGFDGMPADELMAVVPGSFAFDAGAEKPFVPAFESNTIAARHQQAFGDCAAVAFAGFGATDAVLIFGQCGSDGDQRLMRSGTGNRAGLCLRSSL